MHSGCGSARKAAKRLLSVAASFWPPLQLVARQRSIMCQDQSTNRAIHSLCRPPCRNTKIPELARGKLRLQGSKLASSEDDKSESYYRCRSYTSLHRPSLQYSSLPHNQTAKIKVLVPLLWVETVSIFFIRRFEAIDQPSARMPAAIHPPSPLNLTNLLRDRCSIRSPTSVTAH